MSIEARFDAVLTALAEQLPELELLPERLARACVRVLPVAGAGLSALAHPDLRLPIGASDDTAAYVERLQFTYAEGPCLQAYASGRAQLVTLATMARTWPELHRDVIALTPFRAIMSLPLRDEGTRIGALDLYLTQPAGLDPVDLADAFTVALRVGAGLAAAGVYTAAAQQAAPFTTLPASHPAPMARRIMVWKAMGVLNVHLDLSAPDALAVLRARAYATERLVDDIAYDLLTDRLPVQDLRP